MIQAPVVGEPLATVVVLNYNGRRFLQPNLESLLAQKHPNIETIVVDNGSTDGSLELLRRDFPWVKLIESPENAGWTANNLGIEAAGGKYIVLINNDTVAEPELIGELVTQAETDPTIGMCAPKILMRGRPGVLDSAGLSIYPDGMSRQRGRLEKDDGRYDAVEDVLIPSGCCGLYRKEMLDTTGTIDEDFFAYCDDTDLGFRGRLGGWRTVYVPTARIHHEYSGSFGADLAAKAYYVERNHLWFAVKCFPGRSLAALPLFTVWRLGVQLYGMLSGKGVGGQAAKNAASSRLVLAALRAWRDALLGLPKMMRKRRVIQRFQKVSDDEVRSWLRKYRISAANLALTE